MKKQAYKVRTRFIFEGDFEVQADNKQQAEEYVGKHCGLVIGGNIHSTLPTDTIDWNFNVHPTKIIVSVKREK